MTKTIIRPKQRDEAKDERARHVIAARHPGVKQFTALVRDSILLRRRIVAWLAENDPEDGSQTETTANLATATNSDYGDQGWQIHSFMRQLYFIECALDSATEVIIANVYQHVMPECFPAEAA